MVFVQLDKLVMVAPEATHVMKLHSATHRHANTHIVSTCKTAGIELFLYIAPMPTSWFGYCTTIVQDVNTGGGWGRVHGPPYTCLCNSL